VEGWEGPLQILYKASKRSVSGQRLSFFPTTAVSCSHGNPLSAPTPGAISADGEYELDLGESRPTEVA
jgi:hypothetical protein